MRLNHIGFFMSANPTPFTRNVDFSRVYEPAEDSFVLLDSLEMEIEFLKVRFQSQGIMPLVLELGTGSGIVTAFMHQSVLQGGALFLTGDVNIAACEASLNTSSQNGGTQYIDTIQGSLTTYLRKDLGVDILVFNPPYVPTENVPPIPDLENEQQGDSRWLDLALDGGVDGMEVTYKVLNNLGSILSSNGVAYILFCKRNQPEKVSEYMSQRGFYATKILERTAGFEVLSVYRFSPIINK